MASQPDENLFLQVSLAEVGDLAFDTFDEFKTWYSQEKNFFTSLLSSKLQNANYARQRLQPKWQQVDQQIQRVQQAIQQDQNLSNVVGQLRQAIIQFYQGGPEPLFLSDSPQAIFLKELHARSPDDAAAALSLMLRQNLDPQQPSTYRGAVAVALFEKGVTEDAESQRMAVEEVYRDGKKQVAVLKGHHTRLQKSTEEFENANQELLVEVTQQHEELKSEHQESLAKSLAEAEEALTAHEQTYSEKLALHSAVQYWKRQEKRRSKQARNAGIGFALSLIAAAGLLFYFSVRLFDGEITAQKIGAILLTISPLFWGLRVLARLLLSYVHLGTDAAERQILIETYLALHKEDKVDDEDREFLLAAIFRPASTGIVRDDAAPAWSDVLKFGGK